MTMNTPLEKSHPKGYKQDQAHLLLTRTLEEVSTLLTRHLPLDEVLERLLDLLGQVVSHDSVSY